MPEARYLPHKAPTASTTVISAAATESAFSTPIAARSATKMYVIEYCIWIYYTTLHHHNRPPAGCLGSRASRHRCYAVEGAGGVLVVVFGGYPVGGSYSLTNSHLVNITLEITT